MEQILLAIHVLASIGVIGLVLIQQGKGSEVGASFGSGASQTIFGSQGTGNFLTRLTAIFATLFFATSLGLGYMATHQFKQTDLDELLQKVQPAESSKTDSQKDNDIPSLPTNE